VNGLLEVPEAGVGVRPSVRPLRVRGFELLQPLVGHEGGRRETVCMQQRRELAQPLGGGEQSSGTRRGGPQALGERD
jgi:hypothetical protein